MTARPDATRHDLLALTDEPAPRNYSPIERHRRDLVTQVEAACGDLPYPFAIYTENDDGGVDEVLGWGLDLPNGTVVTIVQDPDGSTSYGTWSDPDVATTWMGAFPAWLVRNRWVIGRG